MMRSVSMCLVSVVIILIMFSLIFSVAFDVSKMIDWESLEDREMIISFSQATEMISLKSDTSSNLADGRDDITNSLDIDEYSESIPSSASENNNKQANQLMKPINLASTVFSSICLEGRE